MAASYPIMGGSNVNVLHPGLTPVAADGGGSLPVSTFSMIDEVELKRQRRKLSNRLSSLGVWSLLVSYQHYTNCSRNWSVFVCFSAFGEC